MIKRAVKIGDVFSIAATKASVDALMCTKPESRFRFIQERAAIPKNWTSELHALLTECCQHRWRYR